MRIWKQTEPVLYWFLTWKHRCQLVNKAFRCATRQSIQFLNIFRWRLKQCVALHFLVKEHVGMFWAKQSLLKHKLADFVLRECHELWTWYLHLSWIAFCWSDTVPNFQWTEGRSNAAPSKKWRPDNRGGQRSAKWALNPSSFLSAIHALLWNTGENLALRLQNSRDTVCKITRNKKRTSAAFFVGEKGN